MTIYEITTEARKLRADWDRAGERGEPRDAYVALGRLMFLLERLAERTMQTDNPFFGLRG